MNKKILVIIAIVAVILLVIIGIGINNSDKNNKSGSSNNSNMSAEDLEKHEDFNEKFTRYEGKNVKGSDVKRLVQNIKNHNMTEKRKVTYKYESADKKFDENSIDDNSTYEVELYYDMEGYVNSISIHEN